ncbi:MAG: malectin domain-containing carbohydrate-binding protein [Granulosicoccus sp.]
MTRALSLAVCLVVSFVVSKPALFAEDEIDTPTASNEPALTAELGISKRTIDFGGVAPGEAQSAIVVLTNNGAPGAGSIVIDNLFLDELDSQFYTLSTNAPITLAPSESLDLVVGFEPDKLGLLPGRLTVSHSGHSGVDIIDLNGEGEEALVLGAANPVSLPFGKSTLAGFDGYKPTSLQFGPDGRLYVAYVDGEIRVMDVERKGANEYAVSNTDVITLVKNITNHNDDGSIKKGLNQRLITGLLVSGTQSKPVIYVLSSDPRIGGGHSGNTTGLDTNSGILSRLTKTNTGWEKLDLVRGLPRSEENHHGNGMALVGSTLYLASGGNTNMGAISNNFAMLPEYALSAAILSVELDQIGDKTYDLPTLDDEDRGGPDDYNDPFGGNRGKNQAMLVEGGPVQVYAPGFRNPYDIVVMTNGKMYSWDNGPNSGWGGAPVSCFNSRKEPGTTQHDALHLIDGRGYYAGHPNPTRGSQKNRFNKKNPQTPVPYGNPIECHYYGPGTMGNGKNKNNPSLVSLPRSTNGLTEYTASNLSGALAGDLLAVSWDNKVYHVSFKSSGELKDINVLFSNVGVSPLDVTAQSDTAIFPGTIWVADLQSRNIIVYEPDDYEGGGSGMGGCTVGGGNGDADGDGFSDSDEIANGTDGCSAADVPADVDGDQLSDLVDPDDDNDNILDVDDPFAIDASNGAGTPLPVDYQWENDSPDPGFIASLGFTGLMTNGVDSYQDQYDLNEMTIIGAAGVVTVDNVPPGDPLVGNNSQQFGFQFGVDVGPSSGLFRVQTRLLAPFAGFVPKLHQSMGVYIGTGDQDNYLKLIIKHNVVQVLTEVEGKIYFEQSDAIDISESDYVDLILEVDPASAIATAYLQITKDDQTGQEVQIATVDFPAAWLAGSTKLAVGILSTSINAQTFPATWDFLTVKPLDGVVVNQPPKVTIAALDDVVAGVETTVGAVVTDDGMPGDTIDYQWSLLSGPAAVVVTDATSPLTGITFDKAGVYQLQLSADDGDLTNQDSVTVTVISEVSSEDNVVYRINAGGPMLKAADGDWQSDSASSSFYNTGFTWETNAAIDVSGINTNAPAQLFGSERFDRVENPELEWALPVTPGTYVVNLYFAEIFYGAMKTGGRVFDVAVEDQLLTGIDVFASVGANKAMMQSFTVQADETLNILFTRVTQNPAIKAIEVLKAGGSGGSQGPIAPPSPNKAPVVNVGVDKSVFVSDTVALSAVVADDGLPLNSTTVAWTVQSGPGPVQFKNVEGISTTARFSNAGVYVLRLSASDTELESFDELTISVEQTPTFAPSVVYRINAGGPSIIDATGNWAADTGASSLANTGYTYIGAAPVNSSAVQNVPASLFQSERWDAKSAPAMKWSLPVKPGRYEVRLYFSEIYSGTMGKGKRVFNVSVEEQTLSGLDVYAEAGSNAALVKTFSVESTDGVIDIGFDHIVENPAIKGIEVITSH